MINKLFNKNKWNKGFTLIELILVIPFISIVLILAYSIIFMSNKSFTSAIDNFSSYEDIRVFQINIQKEANQARKSGIKIEKIGKDSS